MGKYNVVYHCSYIFICSKSSDKNSWMTQSLLPYPTKFPKALCSAFLSHFTWNSFVIY